MSNCPICKSENHDVLGFSQIGRGYFKAEGNRTTEGSHYYSIHEYLCLDCGYVYKEMNEGNLKEYLNDKPYFK